MPDRPSESGPTTAQVIAMGEAPTLAHLFQQRVRHTPAATAYLQYDRTSETWREYSWQEMADEVGCWRQGLHLLDMRPGDRIAIWLPNCVAWVHCEQAALAEGLVVVPLYARDNPENQAYIINDCACRILVIERAGQWRDLLRTGARFPVLEKIVVLEEQDEDFPEGNLLAVERWLPSQQRRTASPMIAAGDLATIVYTSGTTGRPKGVMLSHRNILSNCNAVLVVNPAQAGDRFLSFLPLSHTFERTVGYYIPMMTGATIAYARSIPELADDLLAIRPTVLVSVPRIYERISARIDEQLGHKGRLASILFEMTVTVGFRRFEALRDKQRQRLTDRLLWFVLKRLIADRFIARFGGRLRMAVTGGAPLQENIARRFIGLGLPLIQGYGLTEAAPVVSTNCPDENRPTSVGRPLPGVDVRLSPARELMVRGPGVMLGYWGQPELTRNVLDDKGWLRTGDIVRFEEGFLYIIGRSKELIVTSTGEKVAPSAIELALESDPLIDQALLVGEGRPFVAAILVLNTQAWRLAAAGLGTDPDRPLSSHDAAARDLMLTRVSERLRSFPAAAQVHDLLLTTDAWTIENGLLTPTLKPIRQRILDSYAADIETLYARHHGAHTL